MWLLTAVRLPPSSVGCMIGSDVNKATTPKTKAKATTPKASDKIKNVRIYHSSHPIKV